MTADSRTNTSLRLTALAAVALASALACSGARGGSAGVAGRTAIRITGSDTMVNLVQAWAEHYKQRRPAVVVQVAGGGSGVGIAGLIDGTLDIAAASREMKPAERERAKARHGTEPRQFTVALDALAVYIHKDNPLASISLEDLAEIYGEGGWIVRWSQLGIHNAGCRSDRIIRIGRQNNSGTYAYFRDVVLGGAREYKLGSVDQSGSKDVVALVSTTPCAIGYSGIAFATDRVRPLEISVRKGAPAIAPRTDSVVDGSYPLARPLYLYTMSEPAGAVKELVDWVLAPDGQHIVRDLGFVPAPRPDPSSPAPDRQ